MASIASRGAADRMAARILFRVLWAGSGTSARYSSTVLGAVVLFAAEPRLLDLAFFMRPTSSLSNAAHRHSVREEWLADSTEYCLRVATKPAVCHPRQLSRFANRASGKEI